MIEVCVVIGLEILGITLLFFVFLTLQITRREVPATDSRASQPAIGRAS